ncbi:SGNH/GDSL hydrolase family protein [Aquimarina sp. RZ0]|uniref:SGNH/GDSL hydrolase family protein n=1 Tax=Aquimarina sp. RZ0 TaxID=2607730 RepID=UPI0011F3BC97|nr:SGNH/GDSL hydrolase family protein [Aquimarina sp. RZ0]KAA1243628.1 SGNH/GDSL hydrolase family protein [Aquimarina sp. RZ0]
MSKKIIWILIFFLQLFICCSSDTDVDTTTEEEIKKFSFLALGDSYTIGQGVEQNKSWPFQLRDSLQNTTRKIPQLTVIAKTGWTTSDLIQAIEQEDPESHDLVSLLIGVNNQFQNLELSEFQQEFTLLLNTAVSLAGNKNKVIVISIPDYGVTPFGGGLFGDSVTIAKELNVYNAYIRQQCLEQDISFIDVTTISRAFQNAPMALAPDNLHPSGFQYSEWVKKILPVAEEILK